MPSQASLQAPGEPGSTKTKVAFITPPVARLCTAEVPIPYAKHLEQAALPQVDGIVAAVRGLFGESPR